MELRQLKYFLKAMGLFITVSPAYLTQTQKASNLSIKGFHFVAGTGLEPMTFGL
jgi:hypothetical protein